MLDKTKQCDCDRRMHSSPSQLARLDNAVLDVRKHTDRTPKVALVLGSGLGAYADTIEDPVVIPYGEIRTMPESAVAGHAGNLVLGKSQGVEVVAMQGRTHLYEGHSPQDIVFGARLMIKLGAEIMLVTNAAGGIDPSFDVGDLMLITDHLNMTGMNCLTGINEDALGPRFLDMTTAYDRELGGIAKACAKADNFSLREGVYAGLLGPTYETPAEIKMLSVVGANAVGMSTVLETIAARHMGARVLGISCITNKAAGLGQETLNHAEVKETAERVKGRFLGLVGSILSKLA